MPSLDNAHALVVGIAAYQHVQPLPANVRTDAEDLAAVLVDPGLCAYPEGNVGLLLDGEATAQSLRYALQEMAQRTDADSTVTFYLSGHGGRIPTGPRAGEYILPVDARYDPGAPDTLASTAISGEEFSGLLRAIPARKLLVILDCCHAGGIGTPKGGLDGEPLRKGLSDALYERLQEGYGRVILASARPDEESFLLAGDRNSLFTKHLLAGLRGGAGGEDEFVRVFQLYEYVQPRVTGEHPGQHPRFKSDMEENFPVGLFQGGRKAPPSPPTDPEGYRYDVYVSYVDAEPDAAWVWDVFLPRLESAGVESERIAVAGEVERPGVSLVVEVERALATAKRVLLVLSERYVEDNWVEFQNQLIQFIQVGRGEYRLLPVIISASLDPSRIPARLAALNPVDVSHPRRGDSRLQRVIAAIQGPLPTRGG